MKSLAYLLLLGGCITSGYQPIDGPTIKVVYQAGQEIYRVGERQIVAGVFGGGIVEAVAGVPLAEEAAKRATRANYRVLGGFGLLIGAPVMAIVGVAGDRPVMGILATLGMSIVGYGLIIEGAISAPMARLDAINIYNDAVLLQAGVIKPPALSAP